MMPSTSVAFAALPSGYSLAPHLLPRVQDAQLVVDEHVAVGGVARLYVVELVLLVDVDQHLAVYRVADARTLDLERLEHHVTVAQDHRLAVVAQVGDRLERAWVDAFLERILNEEARDLEQARVARVGEAEALERAQVVRVAELHAQLLEELPVALLTLLAEGLGEVLAQVGGHRVVVEQGVVDVEKEDDTHARHRSGTGRAGVGAFRRQR